MDDALLTELCALEEKLSELEALRVLGSDDPPQARLRSLAERFPGALRELDRTQPAVLALRRDALRTALAGGPVPASVLEWARAMSRYHGWLRIALRLRRESARTDGDARVWATTYRPIAPGDPAVERLSEDVLAALLRPPHGRLARIALALTAADVGSTPDEVERTLFGR